MIVSLSKDTTSTLEPTNHAFALPNLTFLRKYDEALVYNTALAERCVCDDPNAALINLNHSSSYLCSTCGNLHSIMVEEHESQRVAASKVLMDGRGKRIVTKCLIHVARKSVGFIWWRYLGGVQKIVQGWTG